MPHFYGRPATGAGALALDDHNTAKTLGDAAVQRMTLMYLVSHPTHLFHSYSAVQTNSPALDGLEQMALAPRYWRRSSSDAQSGGRSNDRQTQVWSESKLCVRLRGAGEP
jgi:hypothetical protein